MNHNKRSLRRQTALPLATLAFSALPFLGCSPSETVPQPSSSQQPLNDAPDGNRTITTASTVVNTYAHLMNDAAVNATTLTVVPAQLTAMGLAAGDLIMVAQPQGATIGTTDDNTYGTITAANGSGRFEFIGVKAVNTTTGVVTLDTLCNGLKNAYTVAGNTQIVRVPQYADLTVTSPGSVVAPAWDGATGGIVAVRARHLTVGTNASISASGSGFRGGQAAAAGNAAMDTSTFVSATNSDGGGKGEGIAGLATNFARGANGNGGGGGNSFGAGGGGGANGGGAAGWKGNGVMNLINANDMMAWGLDPEANNGRTTDGGGGRGGYTQAMSVANEDATATPPGNAAWGGNLRRERGGRGGIPVPNDASTRIYFGGGGGAGAPTTTIGAGSTGGDGGRGGGIVYVIAGKADGDGRLVANGAAGTDITAPLTNGPGGGGAGGTLIVNATTVAGNLTLQANGGRGGSQRDAVVPVLLLEAEGPGGGGGGGFIAVPMGTPGTVQQLVQGAQGGITESQLLTEFPSNGATDGKAGLSSQPLAQPQTPICAPLDLRISVTDGLTTDKQGTRLTYYITIYNDGPFTARNAPVTGVVSPSLINIDWVCSASGPSDDVEPSSCTNASGTGDLNTSVTLPAGASATIQVRVPLLSTTTGAVQYQTTVGVPAGVSDINMTNNTATDTTTVGPEANLRIKATVAPATVKTGQPITYILATNNAGPNTANNVVVTFDVPQNASVVSDPIGDGWSCKVDQSFVTCTRATLTRGPAPDITISVLPDGTSNFALGSGRVSSDSSDPDLSDNSASAVATIEYDPDGFQKPVLAGGGIGCAQVPGGNGSPLSVLGMLLATALMLTRRRAAKH